MTSNAIVVEDLHKRFGDVEALAGIDLEVAEGTVFGLLGPNGAGKTTAVRVLATVLQPDGGRAEVLGYDVVRQPEAVRRRIGLAGQYAAVDPNLTGRENLRMVGLLAQLVRSRILRRAAELLERFDLTSAADRPLRTYSGGMRRRLDIAASLMQRPPVLFLDEPTTGLDITSRNELWEMIRELVNEGTTVLLTTQYLEEADRLAGRIAVVDEGRVIANDTPEALKSQLGSTARGKGAQHELDRGFRADDGRSGSKDPLRSGARHLRHHAKEPDRLSPRPTAARVLHDPAGDLRADVPVRLRRGDHAARSPLSVRRLPDAGDLHANGCVPRDRHRDRSS